MKPISIIRYFRKLLLEVSKFSEGVPQGASCGLVRTSLAEEYCPGLFAILRVMISIPEWEHLAIAGPDILNKGNSHEDTRRGFE